MIITILLIVLAIIGLLNMWIMYKTQLPYAGDLYLTESEDGTPELYYISVSSFETLKNNRDVRVKVIKR